VCVAVYMDVMGRRIFKTWTVNVLMSVQNPYMLNLSGYSHDALPGKIYPGQPAFKVPTFDASNPTESTSLTNDDLFGRIRRESTTIRVRKDRNGEQKVILDVVLSRSKTLATLNGERVQPTNFESAIRWPELLKDFKTNPFIFGDNGLDSALEEKDNIETSAQAAYEFNAKEIDANDQGTVENPHLLIDDYFESIEGNPSPNMRVFMNQLVLWKLIKYAVNVMRKHDNQIQSNLQENKWCHTYNHIINIPEDDVSGHFSQALCQELVITICSAMNIKKDSTTEEWRKAFKRTQKKAIDDEITTIKNKKDMNEADKSKVIRLWHIAFQRVTNIHYMDYMRSIDTRTSTDVVRTTYKHYLAIHKNGYEKTRNGYIFSPYHRNGDSTDGDYATDSKSYDKYNPNSQNKRRGRGHKAVVIAGKTIPNKVEGQ